MRHHNTVNFTLSCLLFCVQIPGEPWLHQTPVRSADGDGLEDRPGGSERPRAHPEARRAGGQAGEQRHRSQSLLQPHRGGLWYFAHWTTWPKHMLRIRDALGLIRVWVLLTEASTELHFRTTLNVFPPQMTHLTQ